MCLVDIETGAGTKSANDNFIVPCTSHAQATIFASGERFTSSGSILGTSSYLHKKM